jgi:Fatty acid desaturase
MAALALLHGAILAAFPSAPLIAIGVWWNSNTISHNFVHRQFFQRREWNLLFGAYLSILLGIPQAWWRARHLAHHRIPDKRGIDRRELVLQMVLIASAWVTLFVYAGSFFVAVYVPGYLAGLALCALHGHYEHARGTISHYGAVYNRLCFNDGYHVEHHRHPGVPWERLPAYRIRSQAVESAWPAPLRWLDAVNLTTLERIALRVPPLQRYMLRSHTRAFRAVERRLASAKRIAIVGGGLFPRTALVLKALCPDVELVIIDANREHLERARRIIGDARIAFVHGRFPWATFGDFDVLIIPLAFEGDRTALYRRPPAPTLIVHDWIWRKRGASRIVSPFLLKRLNVIAQ